MQVIMDIGHPKKKPTAGRVLVKFLLVLVLVSAAIILIAMSPVFRVREIGVKGINRYTASEVARASGIEKGENGFLYVGGGGWEIISLRCADAENRIKNALPYVESAIVKYVIPDMVAIEITEREPAFLVPYMTAYLLVDRKGNALDSVKEAAGFDLPVIKGVKIKSFKLGQVIQMENEPVFLSIAGLMDVIRESDETNKRKILDYINYFEVSGTEIHFMVEGRITVRIPADGDFDYITRFLREILDKGLEADERGVLDFVTGTKPVFTPERREE
jgi:cell division septal protein FtsQ